MDGFDPMELIEKALAAAPIATILLAFMYGLQWIRQKHDKHLLEMLRQINEITKT